MKRLILVRHGEYSSVTHRLNPTGQRQLSTLAQKLKARLEGLSVLLLSSTALRASDSAAILAEQFGTLVETHDVLWAENRHPEDVEAALALVRSRAAEADVIILVTHYEYVERFPAYFGHHELQTRFPLKLIDKGTAWDIDCEAKSIEYVGHE